LYGQFVGDWDADIVTNTPYGIRRTLWNIMFGMKVAHTRDRMLRSVIRHRGRG
jgi:hypothetical protein